MNSTTRNIDQLPTASQETSLSMEEISKDQWSTISQEESSFVEEDIELPMVSFKLEEVQKNEGSKFLPSTLYEESNFPEETIDSPSSSCDSQEVPQIKSVKPSARRTPDCPNPITLEKLKDILAGIDVLIEAGIVDNNRLAAIGFSAGARRVNWLAATTHRFRAIVSKEGWADDWIPSMDQPSSKQLNNIYGGAPWEVPQNYLKNSALYHAKGATTPTLFLMGNPKKGGGDSCDTVSKLHNALKVQGVKTEYVKYDNEGHMIEQSENRQDALERSVKWIDEHLGKK